MEERGRTLVGRERSSRCLRQMILGRVRKDIRKKGQDKMAESR